MDVILTTRCNGKCKNCSNLMQYYSKQYYWDANVDELISNIEKIRPYIKLIDDPDGIARNISILGGETFLYKDLVKLCKYLVTIDWFTSFRIWTNGSIIPDYFEDLLEVLKQDNRFEVITGHYEWSSCEDEIIRRCREKGIEANYRCIGWSDYGNPYETNNTKDWKDCNIKSAMIFKNKIYPCSRLAHMNDLGIIKLNRSEYLDFNNDDLSVLKYWNHNFTKHCNHCNIGCSRDLKAIDAGER